MQVAKLIDGVVTISDLATFYPNTSFTEEGPDSDFMQQEGIFLINNELIHNPATHRLEDAAPYIDGSVARSKIIVALTQQELYQMAMRKGGQVIDEFKKEASKRLDEFAQTRGYDNILSLCTYINDINPDYVAEATRGIELRSQWWTILTGQMNSVLAGTRPMPASFEELATELPALTWNNARH